MEYTVNEVAVTADGSLRIEGFYEQPNRKLLVLKQF